MSAPSPDVVVIGGGPAGLSCAITAASCNLTVALVESTALGGQLLNIASLDAFPGHPPPVAGFDFAATLSDQVMDLDVQLHFGEVGQVARAGTGWEVSGRSFEPITAPSVVVATGTLPARLGVAGEGDLAGRGVSDCAGCDGPLFAGEPVAVIGGDAIAIHEAVYLTSLATEVTLLVPADRAWPLPSRRAVLAPHPSISMIDVAEVTAIVGPDRVTGVAYLDMKGAVGEVAASAVFVAAGRTPAAGPVSGIVAIDGSGHVTVDDRLGASAPGVFAAGDVRSASPASVLAAMADGRSAAIEALHHLGGNA